jgi:hypothetical protein
MTKPDAKNLFRGLDEKVTPKLVASAALPPLVPTETPPSQAQRQRSRQGKKVVTYYLDPEPFMQLKVLAAKTGLTVQELNVEGLNLLFEKHQVSRIAR